MFDPVVYAADGVQELVYKLNKFIFNPLISVAFAIALAYFLYGMVAFIRNGANKEAKEKGQRHMLWGIIGMVIMVSVFGILNLLVSIFGLSYVNVNEQKINTPVLPSVKMK